jgi:glycosyltransferase involved in cell wall biosynthesis
MFSSLFSQIAGGDFEVHVITNASPFPAASKWGSFIIHSIDGKRNPDPLDFFSNLRFFVKAGRLFLRLHKRLGFDVIQTMGSLPVLGLYVALLARASGCKGIWVFFAFPLRRDELKGLHLALRDFPAWYRFLLSRATFWRLACVCSHWLDGIVVVSQIALSFLREIGVEERKIFLIPPGVDLEVFRQRKASNRPRHQIIYASSCYPWKGVFDLLEAFGMIRNRGFTAELLYVFYTARSESKHNKAFIAQLEQRIAALGLQDMVVIRDLPLSNIEEAIAQADIFACPIRSGIHTLDIPMSILEAMACGLPVIATRVSAVPDAISDGVNGYLVEPRSPAALAGAMIKMLQEPAEMRRMGEESHRLAKRFDVRRSASLLREVYTAVAGGKRGHPAPRFG